MYLESLSEWPNIQLFSRAFTVLLGHSRGVRLAKDIFWKALDISWTRDI